MFTTNSRSSEAAGLLLILFYVAVSSTKDITLESLLHVSNPADYLLFIFGFSTIIYGVMHLVSSHKEYRFRYNPIGFKYIIALNVATLGNWFGLYYALKYLSAPAVSILYAGAIPLATVVANSLVRRDVKTKPLNLVSACLLSLISTYWLLSTTTSEHLTPTLAGLFFLLLSACTIASTTVFSKKLSELLVPTTKIMANRFYFLLIAAFLISSPVNELGVLINDHFFIILFVAVGGTVISLWALQKGIERTDPIIVNIIISSGPVITLAIYPIFSGMINLSLNTYICALSITGISVINAFYQSRIKEERQHDKLAAKK